jgi:hypothetical protein
MARGLLLAVFDYANAAADEFHDWYDLEHIPERRAVAGFGACERWLDTEAAAVSAASYDLDSYDVMASAAYQAIAHDNLSPWSKRIGGICNILLRFEGTQITPGDAKAPAPAANAGALLVNAMNVAAEGEDDFNAWYDQEHLPALLAVPGTLAARRYRSAEAGGGSHRYLAIYHLSNAEVTQSEAWAEAVDTPWSAQVRPHFRDRLRTLSWRYTRGG